MLNPNYVKCRIPWLEKTEPGKVDPMARWMKRRIERSRARCQRAVTEAKNKTISEEVGLHENGVVQTGTTVRPAERS